jgi:HEAT repeat protein
MAPHPEDPMTRRAVTLLLALSLWPLAGGVAAAAPEPTVEDLVKKLESCEDLDCPPIRALVRRGAEIWPELAVGLKDQTEMTKFWTLGVLSEVVVPAAREALEGLLADEPLVRIRAAAAFALGNMHTPEVVPALAKALADKDVNVRFEAASALSRTPGAAAVPALLTALRDKDEDVRAAVVEALAAAKDARAVDHLLRRAEKDPAAGVRGMAAIALANLKAAAAVEPLMARLRAEKNKQALAAVCWALGELGDARAVAALTPLAEGAEPVVKQHASEAIAKLKGEQPAERPPADGGEKKPSDGAGKPEEE